MTDVENAISMRRLAEQYRGFKFNLVPLGADKRPVETGVGSSGQILRFRWQDWQTEAQTDKRWKEIRSKPYWTDVHGVAALCGPISGDLACVDFDTPKDTNDLVFPVEILTKFLHAIDLDLSYPWLVDTPRGGYHVWLRSHLQLDKAKLDRPALGLPDGYHIEIRYAETYAALPGSLHPNGRNYAWHNDCTDEPPTAIDADALLAAYGAVTVVEIKPIVTQPAAHTNGNGAPPPTYAIKALDDECASVRGCASGRNNQLNDSAFALGQLVAAGLLNQTIAEERLADAARACGLTDDEILPTIRSGINSGLKQPRIVAVNGNGHHADDVYVYEFGFVIETPDPLNVEQLEEPHAKHHTWPYAVEGGRMVFLKEDKDGEVAHLPIADFEAHITEEIIDEDGIKTFTVEGLAVRGGAFRVEIEANQFSKGQEMRATLEGAVGALDPIRSRMGEHVGPAIKLLTKQEELSVMRRFKRTGWCDGTFLMPGRTSYRIELPGKLPYAVNDNYDIKDGLMALDALLGSVNPAITTAIVAMLMQAPLHRLAGWQNERYGMFIQGRTGSLKTSFAQTAMCIYGAGFADDAALIKWGEGATRNAIMGYATHAHDMPLLIDNYKPNTGGGFNDFVNLIHNILEGGDKDRLNRNSQIRTARAVHCFPLITGEDIPDSDPASLARLLLVAFEWQRGAPNDRLSIAQASPDALATIGAAWIDWLEQAQTQQLIAEEASQLHAIRSRWAQHLRTLRSDMVNVLRVATNLATSELTWRIAELHPTLGAMITDYSVDHNRGLYAIADRMAIRTAEALEAQQFLSALRELLASGQYALIHRSAPDATNHRDQDRMIGWHDPDGVYLLPSMAIAAAKKLLGTGSLTLSPQSLYGQLDGLGYIASKSAEAVTKKISVNGEKPRVLHLKLDTLKPASDDDTTADNQEILASMGL